MIKLLRFQNPDRYFLRLIKRKNQNLWDVCLEDWLGKPENTIQYGIDFKPTKPITMNAEDLKTFAKEIILAVREKPYKDDTSREKELNLTLQNNEPQFKVKMRYIYPDSPHYRDTTMYKFQFSAGFNIRYSIIKDDREENQYLYENGGRHQMMNGYYTEEELLRFADDLEKEAEFYE